MTKTPTKKELEKELHQIRQELLLEQGQKNKLYDRIRLVGLYIQCLRLMPCYSDKIGISVPSSNDYERILNILEMDSYPEGF